MKKFNILIIDPEESVRESILDSFTDEGLSALVAEEKSLRRATKYFEDSNLHYVFLGPNLTHDSIREFLVSSGVNNNIPTLVLIAPKSLHDDLSKLDFGPSAAIAFPIKKGELSVSLVKANESLEKHKSKSKSDNPVVNSNAKEGSIGTAHQLALVLSKLSSRLEETSKRLRTTPKTTNIKASSIPEAVTEVITKVSRFRTGKEEEDLNLLVDSLVKLD